MFMKKNLSYAEVLIFCFRIKIMKTISLVTLTTCLMIVAQNTGNSCFSIILFLLVTQRKGLKLHRVRFVKFQISLDLMSFYYFMNVRIMIKNIFVFSIFNVTRIIESWSSTINASSNGHDLK